MKIGVCLSGGSLTGVFAHIGFLKALDQLGINYDCLMGTSAGAIISAFAASDPISIVERKGLQLKKEQFLDPLSVPALIWKLLHKGKKLGGILKGEHLREFLQTNLTATDFSKTTKKLYIQSVSLDRAQSVIFSSGDIVAAARASAALPLIYEPVKIDNEWYIDGSITGVNAPEELAKLEHPDLIIVHSFLRKNPNERFSVDMEWLPYEIVKKIVDAAFGEFELLRFEYLKETGTPTIWVRPLPDTVLSLMNPNYEDFPKLINESCTKTYSMLKKALEQ